jgi:hypothetical protein
MNRLFTALAVALFLVCSVSAQVAVAPAEYPKLQFFTLSGTPCAACTISTYAGGTTTPLATYVDSTGTVRNPTTITLNSAGYPPNQIWLAAGNYKFVLKDALNVTIYTVDNINSLAGVARTNVANTWIPLQTFSSGITGTGTTGTLTLGPGALGANVYTGLQTFNGGISGSGSLGAFTLGAGALGPNTWTGQQTDTLSHIFNNGFTAPNLYYDPAVKHLKTWQRTYGTFDSAAAASISASDYAEPATQVEGFAAQSQLSSYASRDSVGLYVQNIAPPIYLSTANTTFTATSVTSSDFASISTTAKVGMIIDVQGSPVISGIISSINGNTYNVGAWYKVDGSLGIQTPSNGATAIVNPATTVWAFNSLSACGTAGYATKCVGGEIDLSIQKVGAGANSLGLSIVNTAGSTESPYAAVNTVGNFTRGFVANQGGAGVMTYGFQGTNAVTTNFLATQTGQTNTNYISQNASAGFNSQGDATALLIDDATINAILVRQSAVSKFAVSNAGNLTLPITGTTQCLHVNSAGAVSGTGVDCGVGGGGGLADPGSNGIIKRTALNVTAAALAADAISLWSGTCNASSFLRGDGTCAAPAGSGNTTSTALTTGAIPKASGANAIVNSSIDDGVTTANTVTSSASNGIAAQKFTSTAANGGIDMTEGTGAGISAAAGHDICWADSTAHRQVCNNNNGGNKQPVLAGVDINTSDQVTATHLVSALPAAQGGLNANAAAFTGVLREASGTASASELSGDAVTSGSNVVVVGKVNGTSVPVNSAADQTLVTSASATGSWAAVPNCGDASHGLAYSTSTHTYSCQSITGAAGGMADPGANGIMKRTALNTSAAATGHDAALIVTCVSASASGTAYTCSTSPTFTPATGDRVLFKADVANTASATLNVNASAAATIKKQGGGTNLVANDLLIGTWSELVYDGTNWQMQGQIGNAPAGGGSLTVNGAGAATNLSDSTPAVPIPTIQGNVKFQTSTTNASAYVSGFQRSTAERRTGGCVFSGAGSSMTILGTDQCLSQNGTTSAVAAVDPPYQTETCAASANSFCNWVGDNVWHFGQNIDFYASFRTSALPTGATGERIWVAIHDTSSSSNLNGDTPNGNIAGFRYNSTTNSNAGETGGNWSCYLGTSNVNFTVSNSGIAATATTFYRFRVVEDVANNTYHFYIGTGGSALTEVCAGMSQTNRPVSATNLVRWFAGAVTLSTTQLVPGLSEVRISQDPKL